MSSMPPKVRCVMTPPAVPTSLLSSTSNDPQELTALAVSNLAASADLTRNSKSSPNGNYSLQRKLCIHPSAPLVAYSLDEMTVTMNQQSGIVGAVAAGTAGVANVVGVGGGQQTTARVSPLRRIVTVQHMVSQQVLYSLSIQQMAVAAFPNETSNGSDSKSVTAAIKAIGNIQSLQFYDPSTLYWSGMAHSCSSTMSQAAEDGGKTRIDNSEALGGYNSHRWQVLVVQTEKRVFLLNLRQGPNSRGVASAPVVSDNGNSNKAEAYPVLLAHLQESVLAAQPSSNILPLTDRWLLVGCADGSLKCYDWKSKSVIKSIKGLGKGDWIVQLTAANRYAQWSDGEDAENAKEIVQRRILTITKKGICYLIEIDISPTTLDIKPPLARFAGGLVEGNNNVAKDPDAMEHTLLKYDAHNDLILWYHPASKPHPTMLVWSLRLLTEDLIQQQTSSKTLFKPDPNLTIDYPFALSESSGANQTILAGLVHPSFGEETVLSMSVSATGDVFFLGAMPHPNNRVSKFSAFPILAFNLATILQRDTTDLDNMDISNINIRVHSVETQPLSCTRGCEIAIATTWGIVVLEIPPLVTANDVRPTSVVGAPHLHFGAGLGALGKSVLQMQHSAIVYGSLDVLKNNPVGIMRAKNQVTVHESPTALHLPAELQKRPFRMAPTILASPSGLYIAFFWPDEYRYEILHAPSLMQKVLQQRSAKGSHTTSSRNPAVASGTGITGFAWVGDNDAYCILHNADAMEQAIAATVLTLAAAKEASSLTMGVGKAATSATLNVGKTATTATTRSATKNASKVATDQVTKGTKKVTKGITKGVKKSFGVFGLKKRKKGNSGGMADDDDELDEGMTTEEVSALSMEATKAMQALQKASLEELQPKGDQRARYIEMRTLVAMESQASEIGGSAAATSSSLGELSLRGGNRNPPTVCFGGPVLCVGTRSDENEEGHAHFYTRKKDETNNNAAVYVSSGPTLPYPDLVEWDDDGRLCAVVIRCRVAIYLSMAPEFLLLGTVRIPNPTDPDAGVTSVKFLHGVLYCCTWNTVHCVFLGDLKERGVCYMDTFLLASAHVPILPEGSLDALSTTYTSFSPPTIPLPLVQPVVLGYQNGSLIVSTVRGVQAIPLAHPTLRIGTLLASGQIDRAVKWFDAVPDADHDALATFLERRGHPELALQLDGISLETIVDLSMRFGYIGRLEEVVETYGAKGLHAIDMGRGLSNSIFGPEPEHQSIVVCVGAYLLGHGRGELARRLATECLRSGEEGRKDALLLGALLLSVDEADASRLINRAVGDEGTELSEEWLVGNFVREHVLSASRNRVS